MPAVSRAFPVGGAAAATVIVLLMIGCGGDVEQAGVSLAPPPSATAYVLADPPTTTTTVPPTQPPVAATSPGVGVSPPASPTEYVVRPNDSVFAIASRFGLTPEELAAINGWPDGIGQTILPGDTIRIAAPPASVPSTGPVPGAGECPTTYTIQAGDTTRIAVAERFGITFEEMDAANVNTPGYSSFVVGTPITIPCPT